MPLRKWKEFTENHLFKGQDGFFELPYLSNNPQMMVDSIAALPVSVHLEADQEIYTDNSYTKGSLLYRQSEDGLWLISSELIVRQNIISRAMYDEDAVSEYYFLSFAVFEYQFPIDHSYKKFSSLLSTTCTFYKPRTEVATYFYKNTEGRFFNIAFNKKWVAEKLQFSNDSVRAGVLNFLDGSTGFINWLDIVPGAAELSHKIWSHVAGEKNGTFDLGYLRTIVVPVIGDFFENAFAEGRIYQYQPLHINDYSIAAAAEKIILSNLNIPFLGVEQIARMVHVSPTKLKSIFKTVFGFSMLQYQKEKNMLLAMQLLKKSQLQVKNIGAFAGYYSTSKFTEAFKKRFGLLPTAVRK